MIADALFNVESLRRRLRIAEACSWHAVVAKLPFIFQIGVSAS